MTFRARRAARRKPLRGRAVRPRRATPTWFDAARRAASNHLGGAFSRQRHADESGLQGLHLARRAQSVGASHHQHAEDDTPARPFRSAERARVSNASLHTLVPPRCSHSHVAHADCMVLESRAACLQMLQGLSCNRRADASGTSLTQRSSLVDVLDHQEAAEAAYYDMESVPRLTPWCSTGRM